MSKGRCDYRWPLVDPNEEDRDNGTTHWCSRHPGHDDDHLCACGARPGDDSGGNPAPADTDRGALKILVEVAALAQDWLRQSPYKGKQGRGDLEMADKLYEALEPFRKQA